MKLYLTGALLDCNDTPYYNFKHLSEQLRARHYDIVSPHEHLPSSPSSQWEAYARAGLMLMLACDAIILMPGWKDGRLARLQCKVADKLNMFVFTVDEDYALTGTKYGNQNATEVEF